MDHLGNPQDKVRVIHVAGTSGKTSTCYYIASLLQQVGYTVGLTVSPHVDEINERVQFNLQPLSEHEFCRELSQFIDLVEQTDLELSYFEVIIAFAYWVFAKHHVDFAVIEVGLGGLLDGTNVIHRNDKVCVITDIGFDHVEILGDTLTKIASQKAGIVLENNEVFMHKQSEEILKVVRRVCAKNHANLHIVDRVGTTYASLPSFQRRNFALARAVVDTILFQQHQTLTAQQVTAASKTYIPARMEIIKRGEKTYILDGSHNAQKVGALVAAVSEKLPHQQILMILSIGETKQTNVPAILTELRKISSSVIVTAFDHYQDEVRRAIDSNTLAKLCKAPGNFDDVTIIDDPVEALKYAQNSRYQTILITGSYFLLNHIRPKLLKRPDS